MNPKSKTGMRKRVWCLAVKGTGWVQTDVAHRAKQQASGCSKGPQEVACVIRGLLWGGTSFREYLPQTQNSDLSSKESILFCHVSIFVHRSGRSTADS